MPINIYSVTNDLHEKGWRLISDVYKNLNTELEMECPNGHYQVKTFKEWRNNPICDSCLAQNISLQTNINSQIPEKSNEKYRVLALDAATVVTGFSLYDDHKLIAYGTHKVDSTLPTVERIKIIKKWLWDHILAVKPDLVGIEDIQLQTFKQGQYQVAMYKTLAQLQGVLIDLLFENHIPCTLVTASSWRKTCNIHADTGRENKKQATQEKVKEWYNIECSQDEADAICIGYYFINNTSTSSWGEDIE